ncbi:hypothetical protein BH09SUM1_BH09SUM1_06900 [soil metagenome]
MQLSLIPSLSVILINICLVGYVLRLSDRAQSGTFLLLNGISLILWSGGQAVYRAVGETTPFTLALPYFAAMLVPANYLYYALSRPRPIRGAFPAPLVAFLVFFPCLLMTAIEDYTGGVALLFDYSYRVDQIALDSITTRASLIYSALCLFAAVTVLAVRYSTTTGPEQNVSKHLIATIAGPIFFAAFFWAGSESGSVPVIPSPSLIFELMAQAGLIVVLRQEEITNPRVLSRTIYAVTAILIAFLLVNLLSEFYSLVGGWIVLDRTVGWLLIGAILLLLLLSRLVRVERVFDRMLFARAAEYRKLVEETRHELRDARQRLRRAERMSAVGELAARVAHEIKNPLGPIKGYTQIMREKLQGENNFVHRDAFLRHLAVISEEVENIDRRVRQFLDSSRQQQIVVEQVALNKIVERCARIIELEIETSRELTPGSQSTAVRLHLDDKVASIKGDGDRLEEAIFNIARNAVEAIGQKGGGSVHISTSAQNSPTGEAGAMITVEDTGRGMSEESSDQLFIPFFTDKEGGTGLGLTIVKGIVEAHGGTIEIGPRHEGGTRATLWIPMIAHENPGALLPKVVGQG